MQSLKTPHTLYCSSNEPDFLVIFLKALLSNSSQGFAKDFESFSSDIGFFFIHFQSSLWTGSFSEGFLFWLLSHLILLVNHSSTKRHLTQRTKELCAQITNNLANNQFNIIFLHILFAACGKSTDFIHFFSLIQKLTHLVYLSKVCSVKKIEETGKMEDKRRSSQPKSMNSI